MEIDTSWDSLFNPGKATEFFTPQAPPFEVEAPGYSPINAWWLAEISRLIYKQETEEDHRFQGRTRGQILTDWHRLLSPPEEMADHAPINYVTRLRSALG